jgi:OFA family oxalate/formate antiporter-like MFS transporter
MPSFAADYFGPRNLGTNYGLLFIGWGIAFLIPQAAGYIKDATGSINPTFYFSAAIMLVAVGVSLLLRRPVAPFGGEAAAPLPSVADRT